MQDQKSHMKGLIDLDTISRILWCLWVVGRFPLSPAQCSATFAITAAQIYRKANFETVK